MENQPSPLLNWAFFYQGKSMDELRQCLLLTTMELENTRARAYEDLRMREAQILQLKEMLNRAMREKKDAEEKCQRLFFEKHLLLLQSSAAAHPLSSGVSTVDDEPRSAAAAAGFSSDSDGSMVSSPAPVVEYPVVFDKPLPEKGRLLQAVMKAGPLLQTLLLAGPLPQWHHPPPPMDTFQIPTPPVNYHTPPPAAAIFPDSQLLLHHHHHHHQDSLLEIAAQQNSKSNCGRITNRKRGNFDESDYSMEPNKYQRATVL